MGNPIVEAYIGEYASGKSENAINRALSLVEQGRKVTIADLDIVEPFYTLRPIKKMLEEKGIVVLAWDKDKVIGLGETGNTIMPALRWVLRRDGDLILDVGYGVDGAKTLNLLYELEENKFLRIIAVINVARPMTSDFQGILEYVKSLGRVDALINNTHLGDDTDIEVIQGGAKLVLEVSDALGIPMLGTTAEKSFAQKLGRLDAAGKPVFYINRFMPQAYW